MLVQTLTLSVPLPAAPLPLCPSCSVLPSGSLTKPAPIPLPPAPSVPAPPTALQAVGPRPHEVQTRAALRSA